MRIRSRSVEHPILFQQRQQKSQSLLHRCNANLLPCSFRPRNLTGVMPRVLALLLSLYLYLLNPLAYFASAAILPPPNPLNKDIPLALSPTAKFTNITTNTNGQIHCIIPFPHPMDPVSIRTCRATIDRILIAPWVDVPHTYITDRRRKRTVQITRDPNCAISLDRMSSEGQITISLRQIVQSVVMILSACGAHGEGGWQYMDPPWANWIVIVQGTPDSSR